VLPVLALVCVVAVAAAAIMVWRNVSDDATGTAEQPALAGQLTAQFPTAPAAGWQLTPGQVGAEAFVSVDSTENQYNRPGFIHDNTTVVTLTDSDATDHQLVGVDVTSGRTWTSPVRVRSCADTISQGQIACLYVGGVYFIDARTGQTTADVPLDGGMAYAIAFDGTNAYVVAANSAERTISQVTPRGRGWSTTVPYGESLPSGDSSSTTATSALVATAQGSVLVTSAANGRVLLNEPGSASLSTLPDGSIVVVRGSFDGGHVTRGPVVVVRPDGTLDEIEGASVTTAEVAAPDVADLALIDGRLVDTRTGETRSTTPIDAEGLPPTLSLLTGHHAVLVDGDGEQIENVDPATGQHRWTAPAIGRAGTGSAVTDGERMIYPSSDTTITATNLQTGTAEWTVSGWPGPDGSTSVYGGPTVLAVGDTLVVATPTSITAYGPTGGSASAPGGPEKDEGGGQENAKAGSDADEYVTRCGSRPRFEPQQFSTSAGGLVVTMKVTATCPAGDVLSGSNTRITVKDGSALVASAAFDFSRVGVAVPPGDGADRERSITLDLTFPPGSFLRLPDTLGNGPNGTGSTGGSGGTGGTTGGTTYLVECEEIGTPGTVTQAPTPVEGAAAPAVIASAPLLPPTVDLPAATADALRRQANSDRAFIVANLNNRWVAQLSSKQRGLVADGRVWSDQAILDEFLALRLRFSDVRLLWSGEWSVFSDPSWWVTVAAATFPGPAEANAWCGAQGFDGDHCFAKLISTTAPPDGSTVYRR
jgi:hypothetical protein